jgi:alkanesulfonate monooxygenase SsuD/methylene tetrahydromethanopterin reductase-like flavin-dependent oxidoreductase (luciferase family)
MSLRVGIGTIPCQVPVGGPLNVAESYEEILKLARIAEDAGFDTIWFSEHHGAPNSHLPSPLVMLAAVAAVTDRIGLGTAMVLAPFQHPLRFAEDCAVVDQISHGRLMVGVASGWFDEEFAAFGIPMRERAGRTEELIRICRAAWDNEHFSFHGRYFDFEHVAITPKPAGTLPIVLGNGWVSTDGVVPAYALRAMWNQIGSYLSWHGADSAEGDDLPPIDEQELRNRGFLGTPEEIAEQARPWLEAFAGRELHLLFRIHYPGLLNEEVEPVVRLFASEVIPRLKAIAGS